MKLKVAAIVGPTAVGKTEVSLAVAERLDAEIISVDSMQFYRGMDIGTDKPSEEARRRVPHHLLDIFDPDHDVTVAEYRDLARAAIEDVSERGRLPLLVGGSGLYLRAVVDDLSFPPRAPEVRAELEAAVDEIGAEALHRRLVELDPRAAARIEPGNARRTIRALEVIELTGEPFSANDSWDSYESIYELAIAGLTRPREQLYGLIDERVRGMFERGLAGETAGLSGRLGRTASQALGYRQILDQPDAPPEELIDAIARATRKFARRQESWFRADPRIRWFDVTGEALASLLVDYFRKALTLTLEDHEVR